MSDKQMMPCPKYDALNPPCNGCEHRGRHMRLGILCANSDDRQGCPACTPVPAEAPRMHFVCPACGNHVKADEDWCCAMCGNDCEAVACHCTITPQPVPAEAPPTGTWADDEPRPTPAAPPLRQFRLTVRDRVRTMIGATYERYGTVLDGQTAAERIIEQQDTECDALRELVHKLGTNALQSDQRRQEAQAQLAAANEERERLKNRHWKAEGEAHETPCTYGALCPWCEVERLTAEADNWRVMYNSSVSRWNESAKSQNAAESRVRELEGEMSSNHATRAKLVNRVVELEGEIERLGVALGRAASLRAAMQADRERDLATIARLSGASGCCVECEAKQREIERLLKELERAAQTQTNTDTRRNELDREIWSLREQLVRAKANVHRLPPLAVHEEREKYRERWGNHYVAALTQCIGYEVVSGTTETRLFFRTEQDARDEADHRLASIDAHVAQREEAKG